jgi:hypothetical protein
MEDVSISITTVESENANKLVYECRIDLSLPFDSNHGDENCIDLSGGNVNANANTNNYSYLPVDLSGGNTNNNRPIDLSGRGGNNNNYSPIGSSHGRNNTYNQNRPIDLSGGTSNNASIDLIDDDSDLSMDLNDRRGNTNYLPIDLSGARNNANVRPIGLRDGNNTNYLPIDLSGGYGNNDSPDLSCDGGDADLSIDVRGGNNTNNTPIDLSGRNGSDVSESGNSGAKKRCSPRSIRRVFNLKTNKKDRTSPKRKMNKETSESEGENKSGQDNENEHENIFSSILPHPKDWPYHPIYIQAAQDCKLDGDVDSVPIGIPVNFETSLFKGQILVRICNIRIQDSSHHNKDDDNLSSNSTNTNGHKCKFHCEDYFQKRKRLRQYVIQGQFKENILMSDVYLGDFYQKPLGLVPPKFLAKSINATFNKIAPGLIMDLTSDKPKVIALLGGVVQNLSIDYLGDEPNIMQFDLPDNTQLIEMDQQRQQQQQQTSGGNSDSDKSSLGFKSQKERKSKLSVPKIAKKYSYHPGKVYTFNCYDDVFDLSKFSIKVPIIKSIGLNKVLNSQPTTLRACTLDGRSIFNFNVFHESIYEYTAKENDT